MRALLSPGNQLRERVAELRLSPSDMDGRVLSSMIAPSQSRDLLAFTPCWLTLSDQFGFLTP